MKKLYEEPSVEVVKLDTGDVIATSAGGGLTKTEWSEEKEDQTGFGQWEN